MKDAIKILVGNTAAGATKWGELEGVTQVIPVRRGWVAVRGVADNASPWFDKLETAHRKGETHECKVVRKSEALIGPFFVTVRTEAVSNGVRRYLLDLQAAGSPALTSRTD